MVGMEIGQYRIVEKIGEGGMGVVYKAIETQLDRPVAIKALSPVLCGNPELMERFRVEARAQAQMNHPNVATLYTFLVLQNAAYMVMEFVEGESFDRIVHRRGPLPPGEALPLFRQALAGIGYAHRLGIIHRDLKPSNLMLNREGVVKVMDFGLAKIIGNRSLTATGVRVGTVYYMSPEQVLNRPADARSDIYSLGATFYEILTAHVPFQGNSEFHVLNAHVNSAPPLLSGVCANIPGGTERAVLKALAKHPDERFQTAEEFAAALSHPGDAVSDFALTAPGMAPAIVSEVVTTITAKPAQVKPAAPSRRTGLIAAAVTALIVLLVGQWLLPRILRRSPAPVARTTPAPVAASQPAASSTAAPPADTTAPTAPAAIPITIPAGTVIAVRTVDPVDAKSSALDKRFLVTIVSPVRAGDREVFHYGGQAHVSLMQTGGKKPELALELVSVKGPDHDYDVTSSPYLIKGGLFRKKRVDAGTRIEFTLRRALTLQPQPAS